MKRKPGMQSGPTTNRIVGAWLRHEAGKLAEPWARDLIKTFAGRIENNEVWEAYKEDLLNQIIFPKQVRRTRRNG